MKGWNPAWQQIVNSIHVHPQSTCPCPPLRPGEAQWGLKSQHATDGQTPGADPAHARPASEAAGLAFPHVRRPTALRVHTRHLLMSLVRNTDQASATLGGADSSPCQQMPRGWVGRGPRPAGGSWTVTGMVGVRWPVGGGPDFLGTPGTAYPQRASGALSLSSQFPSPSPSLSGPPPSRSP